MAVIEVKNVTKKFGNFTAVDDVSFFVPKNKIFGLLGSNGSGKTTTINMLTGLLIPDAGEITVLGWDVSKKIEKIRQNIALVPQTISLYENLTVYENLDFFGGLYIKKRKELKKRIDETITLLRLDEKRNVRISHLSGGYQRRCSMGCAFISNPRILFLDEPLIGIDIYTNVIIMNFLKSIRDMSIVFTTHSIKEAEEICDYLVFMHRGQKLLEGTPRGIIDHYSKYFGEQVFIEFDFEVNVRQIELYLKKAGYNIRHLRVWRNIISFTSMDMGNSIIDVLDSLKALKSHVLNIDIKKPSLERIFTQIIEYQR